jgi:hypothetical protein
MKGLGSRTLWRNAGLFLLLITIAVRLAGMAWAEDLWRIYFPVYQGIRWVQQILWGWIPFPLVYLWLPALLAWLGWKVWNWRKSRKQTPPLSASQRLGRWVSGLGNTLGWILFVFHAVWGFNYLHNPLASLLPAVRPEISAEDLCLEAEWAVRNAEICRMKAWGAHPDSIGLSDLPSQYDEEVRRSLLNLMDSLNLPHAQPSDAKIIHPGGTLLTLGISGIYNPFTGEGNADGHNYAACLPEVLGHEMSHGMGYTDEGTCNFLGLLACMNSRNPAIAYSGYFAYYLYVSTDLYKADPSLQQMVKQSIEPGMRADLIAYRQTLLRHQGWMSEMGRKVNHVYLSSQGISGGISNYGKVVAYTYSMGVSQHVGYQRRRH